MKHHEENLEKKRVKIREGSTEKSRNEKNPDARRVKIRVKRRIMVGEQSKKPR